MCDSPIADNHQDAIESNLVQPDVDKLEAMAEFAAGAGHEINNPLATIIGRAQMLLKDEHDPQRRQMLLSIGAQAYRIRDMIGDVMLFGRPPLPETKEVPLKAAVDRVLEKLSDDPAAAKSQICVDIPDSISLHADPVQLAIVISELLRNSLQAFPEGTGTIWISAQQHDKRVMFEIRDDGKGFTAVERRHAFDPFFSGRQAGRGLGFGLSKCWRIVTQHQATIEIESSPNGPTIVRMCWPDGCEARGNQAQSG